MQIIKYPERNKWNEYLARPTLDFEKIEEIVKPILFEVKSNGDRALRDFTKKFDLVDLEDLKVSEIEILDSPFKLEKPLKEAISMAYDNIKLFHAAQQTSVEKIQTMEGVNCWRKSVPIQKVGLYIPGGTAPLFSTVLMLGIPAEIAGCKEIILCSPAGKNGEINPAILYAANLVGIKKIFKVGGAQAIAAMAYGTESIPNVNKIFGPGNQYVTAAKQLITREGIAIDMPAGPSEVAVYADEHCDIDFVAADLLSQAEHGPDSQVILVSEYEHVLEKVKLAVDEQLKFLPRKEIAKEALKHSRFFCVYNQSEAIDLLNEYAAEHLILAIENAEKVSDKIINAGSVFLGNYSPESVGDYASGTNHTLPTNGYAKAYSGVSVDSFIKKITFQHLSKEGLKNIASTVEIMAKAEGLDAHANAVKVRREKL